MPDAVAAPLVGDASLARVRELAARRVAAVAEIDRALAQLERAFVEMNEANRVFSEAVVEFKLGTQQVMAFISRLPMFAKGAAAALAPTACSTLDLRLPVRSTRMPMSDIAPRFIEREVFELEAARCASE